MLVRRPNSLTTCPLYRSSICWVPTTHTHTHRSSHSVGISDTTISAEVHVCLELGIPVVAQGSRTTWEGDDEDRSVHRTRGIHRAARVTDTIQIPEDLEAQSGVGRLWEGGDEREDGLLGRTVSQLRSSFRRCLTARSADRGPAMSARRGPTLRNKRDGYPVNINTPETEDLR